MLAVEAEISKKREEASCVVRSKPSNKGSGKGTTASLDREPRWAE
jgi:hypothetical protein